VQLAQFDRRSIAVYETRAAAEESALVLSAAGIDCRIEERRRLWELIVAAADAEKAASALAADSGERPSPAFEPAPAACRGGTAAGIGAAALLLAFFAAISVWWPDRQWAAAGSASAARILGGEWWRVVTALTLHADPSHLMNNVVALALFATGVCRWFGPGLGLSLVVAAGAAGNALNALIRGPGHSAVGASTAVFGAIGILTAVQLSRRLGTGGRGLARMRAWAPAAAGLALLAFLGSSETSDVLAHLFGFGGGAVLGYAAVGLRAEHLPSWLQAALVVGVAYTVWGCWWLALRG
jgi:rhomboid protease GluP